MVEASQELLNELGLNKGLSFRSRVGKPWVAMANPETVIFGQRVLTVEITWTFYLVIFFNSTVQSIQKNNKVTI